MAPKQAKELENPPMVSSSEEEEEESGSFDEESDPSGEEDDQEKPIQKNVVVPLATKPRPERSVPSSSSSEEEEEEESSSYDEESKEDSDSFGEEDDQEKPKQTDVVVPLANKSMREGSISVPESSTDDEFKKKKMKRSRNDKHVKKLDTEEEVKKKISGDDDDEAKKKMKRKRTEEEISGDDDEAKKKMKMSRTEATEEEATNIYEDVTKQLTPFQRLFSEEDELALLQGILDFTSTRGEPSKDTDGFCDFVKKLICFNAIKSQLLNKVKKLKQKFGDTVKKSLEKGKGGEDKIVFSKDVQQKSFELSRKIWGNAGVLAFKPRKKKDESEKPETNVAITPLSFSGEIVSVFKAENVTSFGLDECTVLARWNMVVDGPKKRAMEENLKTIKEMQVELSLKRIKFVADAGNMIFKEVNASSSGK